jgi:uncharacterized protein YkwD
MWSGAAFAAVEAPTVSAVLGRGGVPTVRWAYGSDVDRTDAVLEIARAVDDGAFGEVARIAHPRRRAGWRDRSGVEGTLAYRARLVVGGVASAWSDDATLVVGDGTTTAPPPPPPPVAGQPCPGTVVADVLALVNAQRATAGLAPLRDQSQLAAAVLSHTGWIDAIRGAGYRGGIIGENIAYGYGSAAAVVSAWMNSAGHRANILNQFFADSGVACVVGAGGRWWWAHDFGG